MSGSVFTNLHTNFLPSLFVQGDLIRRAQFYKTYYVLNLIIFIISYSVCPWKAFPASTNACDKAGAYTNEGPFRYSTLG
jgi:hypothetical protein